MTYRAGTGGGGVATLTAQKAASKKKESRPVIGAVTRVLDIVSRGQYASAGLAKGKGPKESLSMAWQGLQGKQKYTYSDVVKNRLGIKGKPAAVLGFLGDVALDPTTYLSLGAGAVAKVAGKETVKEVSERAAAKLAKKTIRVEAKEATRTGVSTGARKILNQQADEAAKAVATKTPQKVVAPTSVAKEMGTVTKDWDNIVKAGNAKKAAAQKVTSPVAKAAKKPVTAANDMLPGQSLPKRIAAMKEAGERGKKYGYTPEGIAKKAPEVAKVAPVKGTKVAKASSPAAKVAVTPASEVSKAVQAALKAKNAEKSIVAAAKAGGATVKVAKAGKAAKAAKAASPTAVATKVLSQADDIMAKAGAITGDTVKQYSEQELKDMGNLGDLIRTDQAAKGAQAVQAGTESAAAKVGGVVDQAIPGGPTGREIQLRLLGKRVVGSEKAYNVAKSAWNPIGKSKAGTLVGRTFRTGHGLPDEMRGVQRKHVGTSLQDYDSTLKDIQTTFSKTSAGRKTTSADRKLVSAAIARGTTKELPDDLRPLAEYAMHHLDILQPRRMLKDGKIEEAIERIGKRGQKLSEHDDIADVLARQYDKHYTKIAHDGFVKEVTKRFPDAMKTPEVREAMERTARVFEPGSPEGKEWVGMFDKVQGIWKMAVTAPNPGFHIRNMMGDSYLNYLDGVVNVNTYKKGMKLALGKGSGIRHKVGDKMLSGDDVMMYFREHGLQSRFAQAENVMGGGHHKIVNKIGDYSNQREDWTRITHFMDAMSKEAKKGGNLDDIAERAAARVRKFNIDYSDLTDSEKKLKRIIPFYTFARKALPTQLEMVFTRPGRLAALPKATQAIERLTGVRGEDEQGPLPGIDEALPPWLRDKLSISRGNNRIITPDLPVDLLGDYSNPVKGILGGLTPAIKAPFELATGKSIPYGLNQKQSVAQYTLNQTPITRQIANRINFSPLGIKKVSDPNDKSKSWGFGPFQSKSIAKPEGANKGKTGTAKRVAAKVKAGAGYRAGS